MRNAALATLIFLAAFLLSFDLKIGFLGTQVVRLTTGYWK